MRIKKVWRSWLVAWGGVLAMAIANGALRTGITQPVLGEQAARQLATVLLLGALAWYVWWFERGHPIPTTRTAWEIGLAWMSMTLVFEFGLGLATGLSWPEMLADYNVAAGRIWILIPLATAAAPAVARALRVQNDGLATWPGEPSRRQG